MLDVRCWMLDHGAGVTGTVALRFGERLEGAGDEVGGDLRDDGIAVAPQESHAVGYPMSQRECAGFNAPRFGVAAGDEVELGPGGVVGSWFVVLGCSRGSPWSCLSR